MARRELQTKNVRWIDLKKPTTTEINLLGKELHIHPLLIEELHGPTLRPLIEHFDDVLFFVLHVPIYEQNKKVYHAAEVDFILLKDTLVTVQYRDVNSVDAFLELCNVSKTQQERCASSNPPHLAYFIIREILATSGKELAHIERRLDGIEQRIFNDQRGLVEQISRVRRDIIDVRRAVKPMQSILSSFRDRAIDDIGSSIKPYLNDLLGEHKRIENHLESQRETIESLQATNDSILTNRANHVMTVLTVFAVIVFPLTLMSSIFGMNVNDFPIVGMPHDFWIIMGIMSGITSMMLAIFKLKKWI